MQNRPLPVALEWTVGNTSCEDAKKNKSSYICKENSVCVDSSAWIDQGRLGYNCRCAQGYHGNPYLPNGCQGTTLVHAPLGCVEMVERMGVVVLLLKQPSHLEIRYISPSAQALQLQLRFYLSYTGDSDKGGQ
ncbi:hypothetical protein L1987_87930 [Smallanthus sonchifolius]|nr:hypothetical protein L1987_87930 [Smallanthus sonchifolius]